MLSFGFTTYNFDTNQILSRHVNKIYPKNTQDEIQNGTPFVNKNKKINHRVLPTHPCFTKGYSNLFTLIRL